MHLSPLRCLLRIGELLAKYIEEENVDPARAEGDEAHPPPDAATGADTALLEGRSGPGGNVEILQPVPAGDVPIERGSQGRSQGHSLGRSQGRSQGHSLGHNLGRRETMANTATLALPLGL